MLLRLISYADYQPPKTLKTSVKGYAHEVYSEGKYKHAKQVCILSLQLFFELARLKKHDFTVREANILFVAAFLHDAGYSFPTQDLAHELFSQQYIKHGVLPLSAEDRALAADIAYYHRNDEPAMDRSLVRCLAAILKLADIFDKDHIQHVRSLSLVPGPDGLTLVVGVSKKKKYDYNWSPFRNMDKWRVRFNEKAQVFQQEFGPLRLVFRQG